MKQYYTTTHVIDTQLQKPAGFKSTTYSKKTNHPLANPND
jgi:hypothetical protein